MAVNAGLALVRQRIRQFQEGQDAALKELASHEESARNDRDLLLNVSNCLDTSAMETCLLLLRRTYSRELKSASRSMRKLNRSLRPRYMFPSNGTSAL